MNGKKWGALTACLCLLAVVILLFMGMSEPSQEKSDTGNSAMDGMPHLVVEGRRFYISPHLSVADELPAGFEKAGKTDVGGFKDCPYYLNPDIPEWVYAYHEVRTDGTVDATGTLTSTEPHDAYVRYVDERLRGKNLISHHDERYISMWSANYFGENPDVTREYYDEMDAKYGVRIEGAAPDGFVSAGMAEFTGYDTIPSGTLSSNKEAAEVYFNPETPDVVLAATHWFTATAEEDGETRHDGFDVYIRLR